MRLTAAILLLLLLAPLAGAATLADFEKPYRGAPESGGVIPFTVTEEEAGEMRILIYRNSPTRVFNLSVVGESGKTVFEKAGTRGVQTLPALEAGNYRFAITRAPGEFQLTTRDLSKLLPVEETLRGPADAFVFVAENRLNLTFEGNVTIEAFNLQKTPETHPANTTLTIEKREVFVFTLTGEEGTPYSITKEDLPDAPPPANETPAPGLAALALAAFVAMRARGRRR